MLLEIEADQGLANKPDSLSDRVLDGLITRMRKLTLLSRIFSTKYFVIEEDQSGDYQASDYVGTLLRDPTSSHLLETLVRQLPDDVFNVMWTIYFKDTLPRLAVHPVANFVVAKVSERASEEQLNQVCENVSNVAEKIYSAFAHAFSVFDLAETLVRIVSHRCLPCDDRTRRIP